MTPDNIEWSRRSLVEILGSKSVTMMLQCDTPGSKEEVCTAVGRGIFADSASFEACACLHILSRDPKRVALAEKALHGCHVHHSLECLRHRATRMTKLGIEYVMLRLRQRAVVTMDPPSVRNIIMSAVITIAGDYKNPVMHRMLSETTKMLQSPEIIETSSTLDRMAVLDMLKDFQLRSWIRALPPTPCRCNKILRRTHSV